MEMSLIHSRENKIWLDNYFILNSNISPLNEKVHPQYEEKLLLIQYRYRLKSKLNIVNSCIIYWNFDKIFERNWLRVSWKQTKFYGLSDQSRTSST